MYVYMYVHMYVILYTRTYTCTMVHCFINHHDTCAHSLMKWVYTWIWGQYNWLHMHMKYRNELDISHILCSWSWAPQPRSLVCAALGACCHTEEYTHVQASLGSVEISLHTTGQLHERGGGKRERGGGKGREGTRGRRRKERKLVEKVCTWQFRP